MVLVVVSVAVVAVVNVVFGIDVVDDAFTLAGSGTISCAAGASQQGTDANCYCPCRHRSLLLAGAISCGAQPSRICQVWGGSGNGSVRLSRTQEHTEDRGIRMKDK